MDKSDAYDDHANHGERIAVIETWKDASEKDIEKAEKDRTDIKNRITKLEIWKNTVIGVIVFIGSMFTVAGKKIIAFVGGL